ncbi:hypothetical protein C8R46DRAFT_1326449 [Mycena filopes]|nr:hypothetical protein C8R46DRAFT_1326449 [Mycena filopes]
MATSSSPKARLSTDSLQLCISAHSVDSYPARSTTDDDTPVTPPNTLTLLSGPLTEFVRYARAEQSKWLITIAHDLCDPAAMRGSLFVRRPDTTQWSLVGPSDPLIAAVYSYRLPVGVVVGLSKFSGRTNKSKTSRTGDASTMGERVKDRDAACWVTRLIDPLVNSHICPKRMGDHLAGVVYHTFSPTSPSIANLSVYDERFDIALSSSLDEYFDTYRMGFRQVGLNQFQCHTFMDEKPGYVYTLFGQAAVPTMLPLLDGADISPPQPLADKNPPPGLFRWHYLQCVLHKFKHSDYDALPDIRYPELPFRACGDSDDEGTDSEADWPSAALDRGRAWQAILEEDAERQSASMVASWVQSVSS